MTVWPLFTFLLNFDGLLGLLSGAVLLGICGFAGASAGVQVAVGVLAGAALWIASWLRTSIQFTRDDLVVTVLLRPRRIPWARVSSVGFVSAHEDDAHPAQPTARRVRVSYRRDPSTPTGPVPATLGEYRRWARIHFRTLTLPLAFPPPAAASDPQVAASDPPPAAASDPQVAASDPPPAAAADPPPAGASGSPPSRAPSTWFGRQADRQRQIIRREFAARGYPLPD